MKKAVLLLAIAGCGAGKASTEPDASIITTDGGAGDAPLQCTTNVTFSPSAPIAGDVVTATATISNLSGFPSPRWAITFNGATVPYTTADPALLVVQFPAATKGTYDVHFDTGDPFACTVTDAHLQVNPPGANQQQWRLRVIPTALTAAPPQERVVTVTGGVDNTFGTLQLDPGLDVSGAVVDDGGAPIAAYLRFTPQATPDVSIETFSAASGAFQVRVQQGKQDVLIVPAAETIAPARIAGWTAGDALALPAADAISGTVLAPSGQPLAGARVALSIAGVPTTIATTDAGGAWSVRGHAGGAVDVTVVPPDATGLPRLQVRGATLDVAQPITIRYASTLTTIDLGGATIRDAGVDAPGARVTFTGTIASAGTVVAATKSITASGQIQTIARADASAVLLAQKIVAAPVTAVVEPSPTVEAVLSIDLAGGRPAMIDAPAPVTISGTIVDPGQVARGNVRVRLTPIGALAAGTLLVPAATTDASGHFAISAAAGGRYALAANDLARQYSEIDVADVTAGDTGTLALGPSLVFSGTIGVLGGTSPVADAAISILCATCSGVDRSRSLAEAVTAGDGAFRLLVPDPGTQP